MKPKAVALASVLGLALGAVAAHLAVSGAFAIAASSQAERMPNVRNFRTRDWMWIASAYFDANAGAGVVAVGSSFTYGFRLSSGNAFPAVLSDLLGEPVLNASAIGASMLGERFILCGERRHRRAIILEVPLVNETANLRGQKLTGLMDCPDWHTGSFFSFALARVRGLWWMSALGDADARPDEGTIVIGKVPDDYFVNAAEFDRIEPALMQRMRELYEAALPLADEVYLLVTPVYLAGVTDAGQSAEAVRVQVERAYRDCAAIAQSRCISTASLLDRRELYLNLTHLNGAGHAALAEIVAEALRAQALP